MPSAVTSSRSATPLTRRARCCSRAQLPVASWHAQIGDPTIADSILDSLVDNAHRIELDGESMRRKRANKAGKDHACASVARKFSAGLSGATGLKLDRARIH